MHFYTLTTKNQKEKLRKQSLCFPTKRIKYLGINLPKETKDLYAVRNWWKKSKTTQTDGEIYHVLGLRESVLWKFLHYPKQSTESMWSLSNYQRHFSQNWNTKFYNLSAATKDPELSKQSWERKTELEESPPWLQTPLQSCSHQDRIVLAQKQKHRRIDQGREPRNKPSPLWSHHLWQRRQEYTMEKRKPLQ